MPLNFYIKINTAGKIFTKNDFFWNVTFFKPTLYGVNLIFTNTCIDFFWLSYFYV